MDMNDFADRILNISIMEGTVRIDFGCATGEVDDAGNPGFARTHRLIMSSEGFGKSFITLREAYERMLATGLIKIAAPQLLKAGGE
jgi:hypothetical protein